MMRTLHPQSRFPRAGTAWQVQPGLGFAGNPQERIGNETSSAAEELSPEPEGTSLWISRFAPRKEMPLRCNM